DVRAKRRTENFGQRTAAADGGDSIEIRLYASQATALDGRFVHVRGKVVACLALVSIQRAAACRRIFEDRARELVRLLVEHSVDAPRGAVGGYFSPAIPRAVRVAEEVVTRFH